MTRADNTRYLTQATARRHQQTLRKASDAIAHLDSSGQPVNFSAVAAVHPPPGPRRHRPRP
jgi:phytoene/squalene synthetase